MRKLISLALLLSPLLAGLAFPAVGDTVTYDNVRYIITAETDSTALYEARIDFIPEQTVATIPQSIIYGNKTYRITSFSTTLFPTSADYAEPLHIDKVDMSRAVHIKEVPITGFITSNIDIDTVILPPNVRTIPRCTSIGRPGSNVQQERPAGIRTMIATGNKASLAPYGLATSYSIEELDLSKTAIDTIPYLQSVGVYGGAIADCYWLRKVRLPMTVRHIGWNAFRSCFRLADINLPESLEYIDGYSFALTSIPSFSIPENVCYIHPLFVIDDYYLRSITVAASNRWFKSENGVLYTKSGKTIYTIPYSLPQDKLIFPDNVDTVNEYAFACNINTGGADRAVRYDTMDVIRHFVFNPRLRILGDYTFHYSPLETAENFGHTSVSHIPYNCFSGSLLHGIELPIELSSIGDVAFASCSCLDSVRFLGSVVSSIGAGAFSRCTSLDSLDLSAQTRLHTISASLCWGDSSLRSVLLPTSVDSIGRSAFSGCVSLSEIEVPVLDPISVDESVFSGVDKSSCRLIVPAPSIGKYRAAPVWRDFFNIESGDLLTLTVLSADSLMGSVTGSGIYRPGDNPYIAANPARGYRFTRWSDGSTEQYRRVALTSDSTLTAYFEFDPEFRYRVSVRTADRTMGSVSPTTAYARHGETVTITATPLSGYRFTLWSDSVTANPRDVTVTRDTVLTAHFAPAVTVTPDTFAVTLLCDSAMGEVSGAGRYPEGSAATLTATPREGYAFTRWEDSHGLTFTDNPLTLTVTCDTTLTALFREDGTGHSPATADNCAAWVTPDGTLRVRCPGCRLMELRTVTGLTLYSGAPADIPLPMPGIYILTLDGRTVKVIRP